MSDNLFAIGESLYQNGLIRSKRNYIYYTSYLFNEVDFKNKKMLDIGGGNGLYSFYAGYQGASKVICLEPVLDGSASVNVNKFKTICSNLLLDNVELEDNTIQEFNSKDQEFDIILLHNSINHLNEEACKNLHISDQAKCEYKNIFNKIHTLSSPGATIIVSDCSRYNFFPLLGFKNLFVPTIEWEKHQTPYLWAKQLRESGFKNPKIRWKSPSAFGKVGNMLLGNILFSFFLDSYFVLRMHKGNP